MRNSNFPVVTKFLTDVFRWKKISGDGHTVVMLNPKRRRFDLKIF
jgi:hypothetical protein